MLILGLRRFASSSQSGRVGSIARRATAEELESLAARIGHNFSDISHLEAAVTHPSTGLTYSKRFERLEFLGDRVLGLVVAEWLQARYPDEDEGAAQIRHSGLVRQETLLAVAKGLKLNSNVVAHAQMRSLARSSKNDTILADALEAVIGAVFTDGGYESGRKFVLRAWRPLLEQSSAEPPKRDPKTLLQEYAQRAQRPLPTYELLLKVGPDHDPEITIRCDFDGLSAVATAKGMRPSKRAGSLAASMVLEEVERRDKNTNAATRKATPGKGEATGGGAAPPR